MEQHFRANQGGKTQQWLALLLFRGQQPLPVEAQGHCHHHLSFLVTITSQFVPFLKMRSCGLVKRHLFQFKVHI